MLPSFEAFLERYPKFQKFSKSPDAREIFDFLSVPKRLISMIVLSDYKRPALEGCIVELEEKIEKMTSFTIYGIEGDTTKRAIGSMIRFLLEPFGYLPASQKRMHAGLSRHFFSAMQYEKRASPILDVSCVIQKLPNGGD